MCHKATIRRVVCLSLALELLGAFAVAQIPADWRRVGSTTLDLSLASVATGPVERVWFSEDGVRLFVRTGLKRTYSTSDFEHWQIAADAVIPEAAAGLVKVLPESRAKSKTSATVPTRIYAVGRHGYRSDDGGYTWTNLTAFQNRSIIGDGLADVAVSPKDPDLVVIAGGQGVWRSLDGGLSWTGLNHGLPNLPVHRILLFPMATARSASPPIATTRNSSGPPARSRGGNQWRIPRRCKPPLRGAHCQKHSEAL